MPYIKQEQRTKYDEVLDYCMEMNYVKPNWERLEIMQIKHINTEWKYSRNIKTPCFLRCIFNTKYDLLQFRETMPLK